MRSGNQRYLIDIMRKESVKDEYGSMTVEWYASSSNVRADVRHANGNQSTQQDEIFSNITLSIDIRSTVDVNEADRISYSGDTYDIDFIMPDRSRQWYKLTCTRIND